MLSFPPSVKIFLCTQPTDMRKSFDTLAFLATDQMRQDPLSGHLFVFCNKNKNRVKILYWDKDGLALWCKRLEKGTFKFPVFENEAVSLELESSGLYAFLEGFDFSKIKRRARYKLK